MTTRAVLYARFSPRPDEVAARTESIELQLERCRAYCVACGYEVLAEFEDREMSGARADNRPGLQEALALACKRRATIVVYALSRLARNTGDAIEITERLNRAGAQIASLSERLDTATPQGQLFFTILAAIAQFERQSSAARTKDAMQRYQRNGRRMSALERLPFGWKLDPANPDLMVRCDVEQGILGKMMEMRKGGAGLRSIARSLAGQGITCRGGAWHHHTVSRILNREMGNCPESPDRSR